MNQIYIPFNRNIVRPKAKKTSKLPLVVLLVVLAVMLFTLSLWLDVSFSLTLGES